MRFFIFISFMLLGMVPLAHAQDDVQRFKLQAEAVSFATIADVYSAHCDKESHLAKSFLIKFETDKAASPEELEALERLHKKHEQNTTEELSANGLECKDVEFMVLRLQVMQKLRDVSYRLNGVDPQTLPQPDMPDLETLLPPPRDIEVPEDM